MYQKKSDHNPATVPLNLSFSEVKGLVEDILKSGLSIRAQVTGTSMTPFLRGGEVLTIRKVGSSSLRIGDLIFFKDRRSLLILHRILKKTRSGGRFTFHTKGDGASVFDEPVHENEVLGVVCGIERTTSDGRKKFIDLESRFRKKMNYLIALSSLIRAKAYSAVLRLYKLKI